MKKINTLRTLIVSLLALSSNAFAESAEELADKLTTLRAEVETLSEDLAGLKGDAKNELRSLSRQKSDLQIELDREKVRSAKLKSTLDSKREKELALASDGKDLAPVLAGAIRGIRAHVNSSLPFRRQDRLAEIDKIEVQLRSEVLSNSRALSRLWSFMEDEFRMTRENAAFQQTIEFRGGEQLVQVVRVGMVMMFFATRDGVYGVSAKENGKWSFEESEGKESKRAIASLFQSFKKQIRAGFFVLPNALPAGGE